MIRSWPEKTSLNVAVSVKWPCGTLRSRGGELSPRLAWCRLRGLGQAYRRHPFRLWGTVQRGSHRRLGWSSRTSKTRAAVPYREMDDQYGCSDRSCSTACRSSFVSQVFATNSTTRIKKASRSSVPRCLIAMANTSCARSSSSACCRYWRGTKMPGLPIIPPRYRQSPAPLCAQWPGVTLLWIYCCACDGHQIGDTLPARQPVSCDRASQCTTAICP